jgi:arginase family enzyme
LQEDLTEWDILVLEVDIPSREFGKFLELIWPARVKRRKIPSSLGKGVSYGCLHKKKDIREGIKNILDWETDKVLTVYGSGRFHHYTYGLCREIADKRSEAYDYIHFDYHSDNGHFRYNNEEIYAGSFVKSILKDSKAKNLRFIGGSEGLTKDDLIENEFEKTLLEYVRGAQEDAYLSIDLDVMDEGEVKTDFWQGKLKIEELLDSISVIQKEKNLISADILGYSSTDILGYPRKIDAKSLLLYAAAAAQIIGVNPTRFVRLHKEAKNGLGYEDVLDIIKTE